MLFFSTCYNLVHLVVAKMEMKQTRDLWHLRHWFQYWQLRVWINDNPCYLTINCVVTLDSLRNSCDVLIIHFFCTLSFLFLVAYGNWYILFMQPFFFSNIVSDIVNNNGLKRICPNNSKKYLSKLQNLFPKCQLYCVCPQCCLNLHATLWLCVFPILCWIFWKILRWIFWKILCWIFWKILCWIFWKILCWIFW